MAIHNKYFSCARVLPNLRVLRLCHIAYLGIQPDKIFGNSICIEFNPINSLIINTATTNLDIYFVYIK